MRSIKVCASALWLLILAGCQVLPPATPVAKDRFLIQHDSQELVGHVQVVRSKHQDTLPELARQFNLGYEEIVAANPKVDPWLPGESTQIVLPTQFILPPTEQHGVVLNLASMRLFYFPPVGADQQRWVVTHPVGIGRMGWATPTGKTRIISKAKDPVWRVPASIRREHALAGDPLPAVVPPGPENPLGSHALRLALPSYLIHGTNKPFGVGMRVSHGCIRLYPEDIAALYGQIGTGTSVTIINQPYTVGWRDGLLYLEAHQPLADDRRNWVQRLRKLLVDKAQQYGADESIIDWTQVARVQIMAQGLPVPVSKRL